MNNVPHGQSPSAGHLWPRHGHIGYLKNNGAQYPSVSAFPARGAEGGMMKKAATSKHTKEKRAVIKQSAKAMAGRRLDELADPSASKAQKTIRKRRLLNKPV